jgi:hypothetical protein
MKLFGVFAGIMGVIALAFIISLFFPRTYRIERSTVINRPLYESYAYMNNINNWADWSPWNNSIDSSMKSFYSPNTIGIGATHYFRGDLVGLGRFRISSGVLNEMIHYDLSINDGTMHSEATFYFRNVGGKTHLMWVDSGDVGMNPIYRYMLPSKISGTEQAFEEGLIMIKRAAESKKMP